MNASTYSAESKQKAARFCRDLEAAGFVWQRRYDAQSKIPARHFRTYRNGKNLVVRYNASESVETIAGPPRHEPKGPCINAPSGCDRKRLYRSGECKGCYDRRRYAEDAEFRERCKRTSVVNAKARRAKARARKEAARLRQEIKARREAAEMIQRREAA